MRRAELRRKARLILCVSDKAGIEEIKHAYWKLAKKFHPDLNGGDQSLTDKFKQITEAYEILTQDKNDHSYIMGKNEVWNPDNRSFMDDKSYWEWWKKMYGDLI
ncbi:J domain-containing protein [Desulfoscipio gibsoniae]|uniref:DnaJ-class molecular chaperone with C-terminal Zn finger domain n=1 Tax=Desulfoscipio gibsoniae DSM 7213 TaxID=767817 RepID=R4KLD5_9FIRM|nr:J domain-containing protein [Desulfoscipio gibsoniae]AGL03474.1 DnaJ-class molecular chaperone with C-terminal Zn finger domain [Desulfoscipio gibsoniae DSM 7213]